MADDESGWIQYRKLIKIINTDKEKTLEKSRNFVALERVFSCVRKSYKSCFTFYKVVKYTYTRMCRSELEKKRVR